MAPVEASVLSVSELIDGKNKRTAIGMDLNEISVLNSIVLKKMFKKCETFKI